MFNTLTFQWEIWVAYLTDEASSTLELCKGIVGSLHYFSHALTRGPFTWLTRSQATVSYSLCSFTLRIGCYTWTLSQVMDWVSMALTSASGIAALFERKPGLETLQGTVVYKAETRCQTTSGSLCHWQSPHKGLTQKWLYHVVPCQSFPWRCSGTCS